MKTYTSYLFIWLSNGLGRISDEILIILIICVFAAADITDKDDPSSSNEKQHQGASSSTNQSCNGTPTPQQSQTQAQMASVDDGPQEFVPGKKWEWRDPNKVEFHFCLK